MSLLQSVVLGIVQGLSEFLPISSSGHLIVLPWLLGWPEHSLTYDVALHMGTLAALLAYFWRDWWQLATAWLPAGEAGAVWPAVALPDQPVAARVRHRRLGISLVVGTIPAAVIGALFAERVEASLRVPVLVALLLIIAAALLAAADRAGVRRLGLEGIGVGQAAVIGFAQALALAPGVSRSGVTIAAALFLGLTREAAARYAFLLAAPITAGAGLFQLRHLVGGGLPPDERAAFLVGILTSFVVGVVAIGALLRYLRARSLDVFVGYRIALGILILAVAALHLR